MYLGIESLRAKGENIEYTQEMIDEWVKCSQDPLYFIEKYVLIDDNNGGLVNIQLYSYQKEFITLVHNNKEIVGKWPRQAGKTSAMACYIVWGVIFKQRFKVGVAADKDDTATEIVDRIKIAYENVPYWMQQGVEKWDAHKLKFENGSRVDSAATTKKTFRGKSFNFVLLDEFAFVEQNVADQFYTSIYPVVSKGENNKMVIISTPNGLNHFYKIYDEAENKKNSYKPMEIRWNDVPGRGEAFKKKTIGNIGQDRWEQEYETSFLGSSTTLISASKLKTIPWHDPIETIDDLKIFKGPKEGHVYMIPVDVCRGKGLDYHAFTVIDITKMPYEVVAVYKNNMLDTMVYPSLILNIAKKYNEAYVLIELNDTGKQVSDILTWELEYENMLSTKTAGRNGQVLTVEGGTTMGVTMSKSVRAIGCANLKSLINNDQLLFHDFDIIQELTTFEIVGGVYKAKEGAHDDLVMCLHRTTKLETEDGEKTIKWIVDNKYQGKVKSVDKNGNLVWKNIIGHQAIENSGNHKKKWIRINADGHRSLLCTDDHRCAIMNNILTEPQFHFDEAKNITGKWIIKDSVTDGYRFGKVNPLFNKEQLSVLYGTLMGDASINHKHGKQCSVAHGINQKEYIENKQYIFGGTLSYNKNRKNLYLNIPSNAQIKYISELIYANGKKDISKLLPYVDEISLAYWYMDDGNLCNKRYPLLCTDGFTYEEHVLMQKMFKDKWGIKTTIRKNITGGNNKWAGKEYYRLYISDRDLFFSIISPYIIDSMKYKIPFEYHQENKQINNICLSYGAGLVNEIEYLPETEGWMSKLYDIEIEDTHNFMAQGFLVHNCLVNFSWAATQAYFMDLMDLNIRQHMFEKRLQQMEEELVPVGFFTGYDAEEDPADF